MSSTDQVLVELDIFSGRPNPRWVVSDQTAQRLYRLCRDLQRTDEPARQPPALGYRGFIFPLNGQPVRAWEGRIIAGQIICLDSAREIERLLFDSMPAQLDAVRERLQQKLARNQGPSSIEPNDGCIMKSKGQVQNP